MGVTSQILIGSLRDGSMKKLFVSAFALAVFSSSAVAADLYTPMPEPVSVSWTGAYIGGFLGGGYVDPDVDFGGPALELDSTEFIYGGLIGYQWDAGQYIFGVEGDFGGFGSGRDSGPGVDGDFPTADADTGFDLSWTSFVRGKFGVKVSDESALYAAGGLALAGVKIYEFGSGLKAGDDVLVGWTVGGGYEHRFGGGFTGRIEYNYASFGDETLSGQNNFVDQTVGMDLHQIRAVVTFNIPPM